MGSDMTLEDFLKMLHQFMQQFGGGLPIQGLPGQTPNPGNIQTPTFGNIQSLLGNRRGFGQQGSPDLSNQQGGPGGFGPQGNVSTSAPDATGWTGFNQLPAWASGRFPPMIGVPGTNQTTGLFGS